MAYLEIQIFHLNTIKAEEGSPRHKKKFVSQSFQAVSSVLSLFFLSDAEPNFQTIGIFHFL